MPASNVHANVHTWISLKYNRLYQKAKRVEFKVTTTNT